MGPPGNGSLELVALRVALSQGVSDHLATLGPNPSKGPTKQANYQRMVKRQRVSPRRILPPTQR